MPDGSNVIINPTILNQAMEEVYAIALGEEREMWGRVCKSVTPMQPDTLDEKHFRVARKVLEILITNDRCGEFIPDIAYPFLLEPVRTNDNLWEDMYQNLDTYRDPMMKYTEEVQAALQKLGVQTS